MSSDAAELKKLVKQLQSAKTDSDIIDIIRILKKDFHVNEAVLRESKAGLAVGKLRTHPSKEVSDLAKELVKKWKHEVEKAKQHGGMPSVINGLKPVRKDSVSSAPATPVSPTTPGGSLSKISRSAKIDGVKTDITGDSTRDRCIVLLYDALACDSGAPPELILEKALGIEKAALTEYGGLSTEYKSKLRSLFVNLKDKNNPGLRESVASGEITPERLIKMRSDEMASEERKAADKKLKEENFFKSLGAQEQQAETDAFQCGKCKQRKCRYRQAQTRSADEPMTTFVTCVNCGNRWKFS